MTGTQSRFLHVGCGKKKKDQTTKEFSSSAWEEIRLDIDQNVSPDIIGSIIDLKNVPDNSFDAIFSSHNIEHLYFHETLLAFKNFYRVLRPSGYLVLSCPDIQTVCEIAATGKLLDPLYVSPAGPIAALDIMYGFRPALAAGNHFMAHKCAFTLGMMQQCLVKNGFGTIWGRRNKSAFALEVVATKHAVTRENILDIATTHWGDE